jgi:hypothetical protein
MTLNTKKIGWHHPIDPAGQWDGPNDSGIEHFRGDPLRSLAREVCQNSLDASASGDPVEVVFRVYERPTAEIPNLAELKMAVSRCREAAGADTKAVSLFKEAAALLEKQKIIILEIVDSNTTGIRGPATKGTPYFSFMKARGLSVKDSHTASGSYGIGKNAPYAVSGLRTVFVSTVYKEESTEKFQQLTQGKAVLMSHYDASGQQVHQGTGYWGRIDGCLPVFDICPCSWLMRTNRPLSDRTHSDAGTKLSILAFNGGKHWKKILASAVAANFFGAIHQGKLVVRLEDDKDPMRIDRKSIPDIFIDKAIRDALAEHSDTGLEHFDYCAKYLETLRQPEHTHSTNQKHLKVCELRLTVSENLPKRVCFLRNGMFITDSLEISGLKSFAEFKEFSAVFECVSEEGNSLLREMEPPRHDDFESERLSVDRKQKGEQALKELAKWIREELKKHAKDEVKEITTLDELRDFLGDESDQGSGKAPEEVNPFGDILLNAKPFRRNRGAVAWAGGDASVADSDDAGGEFEDESPDKNKDDGKNNSEAKQQTPAASENRQVPLQNVRSVVMDSDKRRISFNPGISGDVRLRFYKSGADSDFLLPVAACDESVVNEHSIIIQVKAGVRYTVTLKFAESFDGALKVAAHEI